MTTIHMETEKVRTVARKMDTDADLMLSSLSQARSSASRLHFAWQGGDADEFSSDLSSLIKKIENHVMALQTLSVRVSREVDEWVSADRFEKTGIGRPSFLAYAGKPAVLFGAAMGTATLPSALLFGSELGKDMAQTIEASPKPSWLEEHFTMEGSAGFGGSYLSRTGKQNWHHKKLEPEVGVKAGVGGAISEGKYHSWGKWEAGLKAQVDKKGLDAGLYAEGSVFDAHGSKVFGSSLFGFTMTGGASAGSVEAFAGIKDNSLGASVGGSVAEAEVGIGFNLLGYNITLGGGAGLGLQAGFKIGAKTEAKLGPFKLGFSIGKAIVEE